MYKYFAATADETTGNFFEILITYCVAMTLCLRVSQFFKFSSKSVEPISVLSHFPFRHYKAAAAAVLTRLRS